MTTSLPTSARTRQPASPLGLHRVLDPPGVLPQAAWRLDPSPAIAPDEVRVRVDRLNLDAASYRQLRETYAGDPDKIRAAVLQIIATRGKMQNPVTGSGGMLTGTVEEVGPRSPLGLEPGQRIATLVSLEVLVEGLGQPGPGDLPQLPGVLDAVCALPLRGLPLGGRYLGPAGEAAPLGFGQLMPFVRIRLRDHEGSPPYWG